jgi:hypothetical protein
MEMCTDGIALRGASPAATNWKGGEPAGGGE